MVYKPVHGVPVLLFKGGSNTSLPLIAMTERKTKTVMKLVCKLPEEQVRLEHTSALERLFHPVLKAQPPSVPLSLAVAGGRPSHAGLGLR